MPATALALDADRVLADLRELHELHGGPDGARRLAWTPDWLAARDWLRGKLAELRLDEAPDLDAAGNLWAGVAGAAPGFVAVGSHIDAVPAGGWLDGALGVLAAVEVLRAVTAAGSAPPVGVRLVDWADEEGARFGRSLLGSSAASGSLEPDRVRDLRDAEGTRLQDALAACGVDLDGAGAASGRLEGMRAYLELHIEQGPVLLDTDRPAAAVSGTVGVERCIARFTGQAAHAGSTPMRLRQDALAAAATAALEAREVAIRHDGVATVGAITAEPGVITAVAGAADMLLDLRHLEADRLRAMHREALAGCEEAAGRFGCGLEIRPVFRAAPAPFHPRLVEAARSAVAEAGGGDGPAVPSGPLHDATEMARRVPTVMVFAQSDPPLSHTAVEDSPEDALRIAIDAYGRTVAQALDAAAAGAL